MTVVCAVADPVTFVAVSVYVVVADGETLVEVPVTVPIPLIERDAALETVHDSVDDWPGAIDEGEAVNDEITGSGGGGGTPAAMNVTIVDPIS